MGGPIGNQNAKGKATGRPTKYRPEHLAVARQVTALGGFDFHIAKALEIDMQTVVKWRLRYPEFAAACVAADEDIVRAAKRSLYHRAMGYDHEAEKIMTVAIGNGCSEVVREPYVEHYPPDINALKYLLGSKSKGEFTDKQEVEQSGGLTVTVTGGLPDDEEDAK